MRVLALSIAAMVATSACGRRTSTPTTAPLASTLDATVVGPDGPVAGARVRMLALAAAPCPCKQSELDASLGYGNEVPACACPEALAQWRSRLARCDTEAGFLAELHADPKGRLRLEPKRGVTSLEAVGPAGVLWMRWPTANAPIALSLSKPTQPKIKITGAGPEVIRGAVLFEDGHCIPLARVGDAWRPRVALPESERTEGTLVIEATGYATTVVTLFSQDQIELFPATPVRGTCEGKTVRLENPFQRLVVKVDNKQQFAIDGALAMASKVSCWEDAQTLVDEWDYTPGEALESNGTISGGLIGSMCTDVKVIDAHNRSIANASVSLMRDHGGYSSGTSVSTDAQGVACVEDLHVGATLHVTAPQGPCAGETATKLTQRHLAQTPLMVRLRIQPLKGTTLHGRVVAPDGSPVAGASVTVKEVRPANPADCTHTAAAQSGLDGAFSIPSLPRGKVVLETEHEWFGKRELTVKHDGSAHDVLLPRGERWSGQLLDPEGRPINACSMSLKLADGRTLYTSCNAGGAFELKPIAPGEARLQVRIENHALGTFRLLIKKVQLAATPRRDDIQFEPGEHISGRVLDKNGTAIPRAQLAALPKGAIKPFGRAHDDEVHVTADELGRFTFRHLAPGTWTLHGVGRTYTQASIDVATGTTDATFIVPQT